MNDDEPQPIECRAAVEISPTATNEILFLPIGLHAITPVSGGIGRPIKVKVGPESAQAIESQRSKLMASGKRPYFDFNHSDDRASFWPNQFIWRPGEGVIARGEWSDGGKRSVEGRDYRAFSPVFHVDNKRAEAATVICKDNADPNMGGLVNNPAFKDLPLWAKNGEQLPNAGATGDNVREKRETNMSNEEIDALRSKQQELEKEVEALKASAADDQKLSQSQSELRIIQLEIENAEVKAKGESLAKQVTETNKKNAESAIKSAIQRGAILPKDFRTQNELIARATSDPSFISVIGAMQGPGNQLATRITGRTVTITEEAPGAIFAALARVNSNSKKSRKPDDKLSCAREFASIYASEFRGSNANRMLAFPIANLEDAIMAAGDVTDSDLGTLAGTLVVQRTLELLKFTFPSLAMFTTDFTSEQATFNQTIMTRTVDIPDVQTYNTTSGWTSSSATTQDVPITIDHHEGVPITFNEQIMASTIRRLFDEQAPAQAYALAKSMVDALYENITDANFTTNIVSTLGAFSRSVVIDAGIALDLNGVPAGLGMRTMLLWPTFFGALEKDTALIQLAAFQKPEIITNPTGAGVALTIPVESFQVVKAPNLPTNDGNIVGFAGSKSALCIASRLPNDYTKFAPGVSYGNVQTVTDPDLGLSVMLVQYVDHTLATGNQRISLMYGTAAGQGLAGMIIKAHSSSGSSRVS